MSLVITASLPGPGRGQVMQLVAIDVRRYRLYLYRRGDGRPLQVSDIETDRGGAGSTEQAACEAIKQLGLAPDCPVRVHFGRWAGKRIDAGYLLDQWTPSDERENP